jgi:hypothetical protein
MTGCLAVAVPLVHKRRNTLTQRYGNGLPIAVLPSNHNESPNPHSGNPESAKHRPALTPEELIARYRG